MHCDPSQNPVVFKIGLRLQHSDILAILAITVVVELQTDKIVPGDN